MMGRDGRAELFPGVCATSRDSALPFFTYNFKSCPLWRESRNVTAQRGLVLSLHAGFPCIPPREGTFWSEPEVGKLPGER